MGGSIGRNGPSVESTIIVQNGFLEYILGNHRGTFTTVLAAANVIRF